MTMTETKVSDEEIQGLIERLEHAQEVAFEQGLIGVEVACEYGADGLRQLQAENKSLKEGWHAMTLAAKEVQRRHLGTHEGDVYHAMQALHTRHGYNSISRAAIDAALHGSEGECNDHLQQEESDG